MQRLLLALLLVAPAALNAQDNPNYDPDYDGDGCYSVADILGLLPLFGTCVDTTPAFACGDSVLFDDYWYETVLIGDQCWFAENLRTTTYADGTSIQEVTDNGTWGGLSSGARCDYGNDASNVATYGRLYNWYAATDTSELCPSGWHVPTDVEWTELENNITSQGYAGFEGTALKSTTGWYNNGNGTDDFGFSALPSGLRSNDGVYFSLAGFSGFWWSSSSDGGLAWDRHLHFYSSAILRSDPSLQSGLSIRCLKYPPLQGCTDSGYIEFNPSAELDDGSCLTLFAPGCTDSLYLEFDPLANVDDGSCVTLLPTEFACGDSVLFDNHWYETVQIGDQCWFAENLRTTVFANGNPIPAGLTDGEWDSTTAGATAVYGEGSSTCYSHSQDIDACDETQSLTAFGRLYNWYAVDDARGLCPEGWHVPTDADWIDLEMELGMSESEVNSTGWRGTEEGAQLKSTSGWNLNGDGTDDFGFSALPGGVRNSGGFGDAGYNAYWWSLSPSDGNAWERRLTNFVQYIFRSSDSAEQSDGYSVRCLKDQ